MDANQEQAPHPHPQRRVHPLLHSIANFYPLFLRQSPLTKLIILTSLLLFLYAAHEDPSPLSFTQHSAAVFVVKTLCSVACVGLVLGISTYLDRHHHRKKSRGHALDHGNKIDWSHIRLQHTRAEATGTPIVAPLFAPRRAENDVGQTPHHSSGILGPSPQARICRSNDIARESEMQFLNGKNAVPQFQHFSGSGFREAWDKKKGALI